MVWQPEQCVPHLCSSVDGIGSSNPIDLERDKGGLEDDGCMDGWMEIFIVCHEYNNHKVKIKLTNHSVQKKMEDPDDDCRE